jgi:hypothetical protein
MPTSLESLLGLSSNRTPGGPNVPAYTPDIRRNSARTGALSRFLGIEDTGSVSEEQMESAYGDVVEQQRRQAEQEAQAKAYAEYVKGQYGLQTESMRGRSAVDVARLNREASSLDKETSQAFTAGQNELSRNLSRELEGGRMSRSLGVQQGLRGRQMAGEGNRRAAALEARTPGGGFKVKAPRPANEGWLGYLFGPSQERLNQDAAAQQRAQALSAIEGDTGGGDLVSDYANVYAGLAGDELLSALQQDPGLSDASPDEIMGLAQQIEAASQGVR